MLQRSSDVIGEIRFFQVQNPASLETTVFRVFLQEAIKKFPGCRTQGEKSSSNRFEAVSISLRLMMPRVFDFLPAPRQLSLVSREQFKFRAVDEDLVLCGFDAENVSDMAGRHGIPIHLELDESVGAADGQSHFRRIIRGRQR